MVPNAIPFLAERNGGLHVADYCNGHLCCVVHRGDADQLVGRHAGMIGGHIMLLESDRAPRAGRDQNVIYVDFTRPPDPPAPKFPGATGLRVASEEDDVERAIGAVDFKMAS